MSSGHLDTIKRLHQNLVEMEKEKVRKKGEKRKGRRGECKEGEGDRETGRTQLKDNAKIYWK
jgi:hypothetical protein